MNEANIALLKRAWIAYNQGDEEEFAACLTSDWKEYGSPDATEYGTLETSAGRCVRTALPSRTNMLKSI